MEISINTDAQSRDFILFYSYDSRCIIPYQMVLKLYIQWAELNKTQRRQKQK